MSLYRPRTLVGHSLSGAIVNHILHTYNKLPNRILYTGRVYNSPIVSNAPGLTSYRKIGDLISLTNRQAEILPYTGINPHSYN